MGVIWFIIFVACIATLAYQRASLMVWMVGVGLLMLFASFLSPMSTWSLASLWIFFIALFGFLSAKNFRKQWLTRYLLNTYRKVMPTMSRTEREALAAGSVGWEGDLFRGNPNWNKLLSFPKPQLTAEEQAFIDGPVETLCQMLDDWDIMHNRADLPPDVWKFIKEQGFFGLIIPKNYGGKDFSAYAHSQILVKLYASSVTAATTVSVPNSLGPAELLLHYGTAEQKDYYLPRLARGEDIPCFALTAPDAGSDAGAMKDKGIICYGEFQGKKVLGIRLNFNKRYITLAPVATVIGLAFKLYDPEHLIGKKTELGITCALIPRNTPGMTIGRRHIQLGVSFQNGPIQGKDVFIPIDWIIGGQKMAGQGWRMLMECLAAGRAISLPSSVMGGAKVISFAGSAYARVRRQFNMPIGRFEGVEEVLARIGANTYTMDATRTFTANMINLGEKPAVASAITKYHVTELGRQVANDGMDIHGGRAICMGPRNYLAGAWQATPVAITVEGANILTRNMIIFGQGAMRCHPYVFAELEAAKLKDEKDSLNKFDQAIFAHIGYTFSNFIRTFVLGLTSGLIVRAPKGPTKRYFQQATRFSSAFAFLADVSMIVLGGSLKRKESISARLGDVLSQLYLISSILKHFNDQGKKEEDLPLVHWACLNCFYQTQEKFIELLDNFPNRWLRKILTFLIFPIGKHHRMPGIKLSHKVVQLLLEPTEARKRLTQGIAYTGIPNAMLAALEDAMHKVIAAEPIEKIVKTAVRDELIQGETFADQMLAALQADIITEGQFTIWQESEAARQNVIAVDDFAPEDAPRVNMI